ncbi:two-component sensor histidine kinase [Marinobacter sp. F3R11]|nr:two-component sensor histidine kinase [Marinobacter sp. F3R11]
MITVGAIIFAAYGALVEEFQNNLSAQQENETTRISNLVSLNLELRINVLDQFATLLTDQNQLLPPAQLTRLLKKQEKLTKLFPHSLLVLSPNAIAIAENILVPNRLGTYYGDRTHFKEVIKTGRPVISRPIIGRATGVPLIVFVVPIKGDDGEVAGLLSGSLRLDQTRLIPESIRSKANKNAVFLVIDTGNFLFVEGSREGKMIEALPNPGESQLIDAALSGIPFGEVESDSGETLIYATSHLQRLGWLFVRAVPKSLATAPAEEAFSRFFLISIGLTLGVLLLTFAALRSTAESLTQMTQRIRSMIQKPESSRRLKEQGAPEVRNLAEAFNQLMDERDATNKLKDSFVSNVSHELRTPLTSLNGALRLLNSGTAGELPESAQKMTTLALRNSERLQLLIADLLDFNKLSAGEMRVNFETVEIGELIRITVASNQLMASEYSVSLTARDIPDLSLVTDGHRLTQILDNFISNAIKFSPSGGEVVIEAEEKETQRLRIIVSDQGKGVPDSFRDQIFERFTQAEVGTTRATSGTGLGLAICRQLATLLNGEVGFFNDGGAHFWVELPVRQMDADQEQKS